ncbi:MAG: hypothetical protein ACTSWY_13140 [Promethearchaeota archaeon]
MCLNEQTEYFNKAPVSVLNHQEYRTFLPDSQSINKENAASYTFDLILLHLFLDRDLILDKTADHLFNLDILKKFYALFKNKFKFVLQNIKNHEDKSISPEIISIIGELHVNNCVFYVLF